MLLPDPEEIGRVNPFDWNQAFPAAMKAGGFDCIIGTPPYGAEFSLSVKAFLSNIYPVVSDFESSQYFIAKAQSLLRLNGRLSFIVPNTIFLNLYASKFRKFIASSLSIERIADLTTVNVFGGATVRTAIFFLRMSGDRKPIEFVAFLDPTNIRPLRVLDQMKLLSDDSAWIGGFGGSATDSLKEKVLAVSAPMG